MPSAQYKLLKGFDATFWDEKGIITPKKLGLALKTISDQFVFQLEKGSLNNKMHYQIRMKLRTPNNKMVILKKLNEILCTDIKSLVIQPTCNKCFLNDDFDYCLKEETRVDGPWTDATEFITLEKPWHIISEEQLYPFQRSIINSVSEINDRNCCLLLDFKGNAGKSALCNYIDYYKLGCDLPPSNDYKDVIQSLQNMIESGKNTRLLTLDLQRAMPKKNLNGLFCAIEQIKKGKIYDFRNRYTESWIGSPQIWVIMNTVPDIDCLSWDRWKYYQIIDNNLVRIKNTDPNNPFDIEACYEIEYNYKCKNHESLMPRSRAEMISYMKADDIEETIVTKKKKKKKDKSTGTVIPAETVEECLRNSGSDIVSENGLEKELSDCDFLSE